MSFMIRHVRKHTSFYNFVYLRVISFSSLDNRKLVLLSTVTFNDEPTTPRTSNLSSLDAHPSMFNICYDLNYNPTKLPKVYSMIPILSK